ncbi:unnamed protein product [Ceratitis capitata]|uniref:(Mediterranean fruit fly) hypothetical protein n=1 Tax=Ceratitis capitata TaxID=7213 RepID=A0A811UXX6_CERCA|nr:unnamed protein product [Ceratitis capitata]
MPELGGKTALGLNWNLVDNGNSTRVFVYPFYHTFRLTEEVSQKAFPLADAQLTSKIMNLFAASA